ncbi:MAG: CHAT domain-containing protein [Symploca sp. SIO1C4]|uniref:CHAT domain-containing protein n=1 Tax=Symploca sp. SIO1C4 TaxID=2607765 RepID=A0A6B3NAZ8_9CYAN|nr:CHAT domain-containing protein [Symploca sp. SIO1C4]
MKIAVRGINQLLAAIYVVGSLSLKPTQAQTIIPAADGTGTSVSSNGNSFEISGGSLSDDGVNLFHSFSEFDLTQEQIANFLSQPEFKNILGRITGGKPSLINGLIQVTGGNSNLLLMNPAGIIFGSNAQLNLPASFTATTATGIGFNEDNFFKAIGTNNYSVLVGTPSTLVFGTSGTPAEIINAGKLAVTQGHSLNLLAGTVISSGTLEAPAGKITVTAVPGESLVSINFPGQLLSLEVQAPLIELNPLSLSQLLTGTNRGHATGVTVKPDGSLILTGSNIPIESGDVVANKITAQIATIKAFGNLTLLESHLQTTGDLNLLAEDTVRVRDSLENSFLAQAGGNLYIQGNNGIDIQALNSTQTQFQSGADLSLVSDGSVSLDAHFTSGGKFSIFELSGIPASFGSIYDPIISAEGDVEFGNYTGVALKVEATGSIRSGNITITQPDTPASIPTTDPHFSQLTESRALILQAGKTQLDNSANISPSDLGDVDFTSTGEISSPASITTDNIDVSSGAVGANPIISGDAGPVILEAAGDIITGNIITTDTGTADSGSVTLSTTDGNITTGTINTSEPSDGNAGHVTLSALGTLTINGDIITTDRGLGDAGNVNLSSSLEDNNNQTRIDTRDFDPADGMINDGEIIMPVSTPLPAPAPAPPSPETNPTPPSPAPAPLPPETNPTPPSPAPAPPSPETNPTPPSPAPAPPSPETNPTPPSPAPAPLPPETNPTPPSPAPAPESSNSNPIDNNDFLADVNQILLKPIVQQNIDNVAQTNVPVLPESDRVYLLEETLTKEFEAYLGRPSNTKINTIDDVRNWIRKLEQVTGIKTGVIYATFTPTTIVSPQTECQTDLESQMPATVRNKGSESVQQQENCLTQNDSQLELLMVTAEGESLRRRVPKAMRTKVLDTVLEFQKALTDRRKTNTTNYLQSAAQLYQWLIEPLEFSLEENRISNLVFSMDEGLRSLPIAALHDGQRFLIENYSISLVPTLSLTNSNYRDLRELNVLAMGASEFTEHPPLPAVPMELGIIAKDIWKGKSFLNETFTLENLKAQRRLQEFGIIHLATHAEFKPGTPNNSYIQLWNRKLHLDEFRQLQLWDPPVELLVLSACRTALGNREAELGFAGSALMAGVDSTLATLWYVSDQGSLGLTTEFYFQLSKAISKAEALRRAQLAMIRGGVRIENNRLYNSGKSISLPPEWSDLGNQSLSHPYYWAAFTLIGDPI